MTREILKFLMALLVIAGIAIGALKLWFVDVVVVNDDRMAPTMLGGDKVLMWRGATPDLGDIAVCAHPSLPGEYVIGRVMGITGQDVGVVRGAVAIGGHPPDRNWIGSFRYDDPDFERTYDARWGLETVNEHEHEFMMKTDFVFSARAIRLTGDQVYLLADLRSQVGVDSRSFGAVSAAECLGTIFMRLEAAPGRSGEPPFDHGYVDIID